MSDMSKRLNVEREIWMRMVSGAGWGMTNLDWQMVESDLETMLEVAKVAAKVWMDHEDDMRRRHAEHLREGRPCG